MFSELHRTLRLQAPFHPAGLGQRGRFRGSEHLSRFSEQKAAIDYGWFLPVFFSFRIQRQPYQAWMIDGSPSVAGGGSV